jgi:soluble lytic murein transglycosylase-like protein
MNKFLLTIIVLIYSMPCNAIEFNKKHYNVIKAIIWSADKVEVPRELLLALCWGESSFRTNVTRLDGKTLSHGICQVKLETAQHMDLVFKHKIKATRERLENTTINAFYAAKYLKYQLQQYDGDWVLAIDAYNKGTAYGANTKYVKKFNKNHKFITEKLNHLIKKCN